MSIDELLRLAETENLAGSKVVLIGPENHEPREKLRNFAEIMDRATKKNRGE